MVVGVEENAASESGFESEEFIVPEFGRVNLTWFDFSRKYRGAIFRLGQDAARQISDIVGFSANFELPGIRTACIDLFKTEGYCLFEIERNTKPTDLSVHYSRERWNLLDATGRAGDTLRPWIKTEYRAKYIPEKVFTLVAEQLKMMPDTVGNFVVRINFKEKTFGVICEERYAEQMPTGGFSAFSLPSEALLALAKKYGKIEEEASETSRQTMPSPFSQVRAGVAVSESAVDASEKEAEREDRKASEAAVETDAGSDGAASTLTSRVATVSASPANVQSAAAAPEAASFWTATETKSKAESSTANQTISEAGREEAEPLPGSTKSLEKFIQRKADRPVETTEQRREPVESSSAKYATYSRSEVDHMLKQQSETIASALGSKISSQQRVFQEAVERQEKSFSKLSDGFVTQFDQTRVRLENSSKQSTETIRTELETFKKDLSKELEQYRAQINKTVVPVAKFIEDKNTRTPDKPAREASQPKGQQAQAVADNHLLQTMLIVNTVLIVIIPLATWFVVIQPVMDKLQNDLTEINTRLRTQTTQPSSSPASTGAANVNGSTNSSNPATSSGSNSTVKSGGSNSATPQGAGGATK